MTGLAYELIVVITDLIRINTARADCFENTIRQTDDLDKELIQILINDAKTGRYNARQLTDLTISKGIYVNEEVINPGKIFMVWNDTRKISGINGISVMLRDYDRGEEAAVDAYRLALTSVWLTDYQNLQLIMDQKHYLQICHDKIRKYRDLQELPLVKRYNPAIDIKSKFINTKAG